MMDEGGESVIEQFFANADNNSNKKKKSNKKSKNNKSTSSSPSEQSVDTSSNNNNNKKKKTSSYKSNEESNLFNDQQMVRDEDFLLFEDEEVNMSSDDNNNKKKSKKKKNKKQSKNSTPDSDDYKDHGSLKSSFHHYQPPQSNDNDDDYDVTNNDIQGSPITTSITEMGIPPGLIMEDYDMFRDGDDNRMDHMSSDLHTMESNISEVVEDDDNAFYSVLAPANEAETSKSATPSAAANKMQQQQQQKTNRRSPDREIVNESKKHIPVVTTHVAKVDFTSPSSTTTATTTTSSSSMSDKTGFIDHHDTLYPKLSASVPTTTEKKSKTPFLHNLRDNIVYKITEPDNEFSKDRIPNDPEYFSRISYTPSEYTFQINSCQDESKPGDVGANGLNGRDGISGRKGGFGENGEPGQDGEDAFDGAGGTNGQNGQDAFPVYIHIEGNAEDLQVSGAYNGTVHIGDLIPNNPSLLWVNARGGGGGSGGDGGNGGRGGAGGDGGNGGEPENPSANNNEFIGGRGGDGGHGGNGGKGGRGGNGGDGGRGGDVLIETTKSELLMFVEVDVLGGAAGPPGKGGKGGGGGKGGKAGSGFFSYEDKMKGVDGKMGQYGVDGPDGFPGNQGKVGGVFYVILNPDKTVKEQGHRKYTVKVLDYDIVGVNDDGVFEPNEELLIKNITLHNDGDLTLPEGCRLYLKETETFEPIYCDNLLPSIAPGSKITLDFHLKGRIKPIQTPNKPGRYHGLVEVSTYCELLKKQFRDSERKKEIEVSYPIQLGSGRFVCPNAMAPNDVRSFKVEIGNISNISYGVGSESRQAIDYRISFDDHFSLLDHNGSNFFEGSIERLAARSSRSIEFKVQLGNTASYYQQLKWRVELFFRGNLIEYADIPLRVCPKFDPQEVSRSDILFITHSKITEREYLLYRKIFDGLGLRPCFFDSEMYNGISKNLQTGKPNEWVGKFVGKPIIFPLKEHGDIHLLHGSDIISHFQGHYANEKEDKNDSGMVIIGVSKNISQFKENLKQQLYESSSGIGVFEISEQKLSDYFVVNSPTPELMTQRMDKIVQEFTSEQPSCVFSAFRTEYAPRKLNMFNLYTYGKGVIKQLPLTKVHRFLLVTHGNETLSHNPSFLSSPFAKNGNMSVENDANFNDYLNRTEFYTEERFFEVLLAIISALSIEKKIQMLMDDYQERMASVKQDWRFVIDEHHKKKHGASHHSDQVRTRKITISDLIIVSLYNDLKVEYFYHDQGLGRTRKFCQYVKNNASRIRSMNDTLYSVWLVISRLASHTYWRSLPYLSPLTEKRNQLLQIKDDLGRVLFTSSEAMLGSGSYTGNLIEVKQKAERDAESKDRLKMEDLQKIIIPFL